ncbi:Thiol-disulfide interchange protein, contains DsbC and DsbD domains [Sulfitobacter marinus]|uniref:Thiol-disulfide interchange protein, contains DsbC and DsbD domains n=1 Tax=Sulfitobacter marinus TaxID=394264 RepID=A0A1I6RGQ6_9RHOB|nr:protein-disulfide reductase DsbD domain-containing protein [Sulfitobacter marinus]SFS63897.1 Thiol-disulfide interchange protein, contains DsbC and DsbD domains [Sulfitobacter marinus]
MKRKLLPAILFALLAPLPASAMDVIKGEILQGWVRPDGNRIAAIRMTMTPGWKTYWRAPGDMGIPPHFDWTGSQNLSAIALEWPTPTVFREKNLKTIGYKDQVVLPLVITLPQKGAPVHLKTTIDLGVCLDVCVPAKLHLEGVIDTDATRAEPAIAASLAQRPYTEKEAGVAKATCAIRFVNGDLELETAITLPNTGAPELVVIEAGHPDLWVSEADSIRRGNTLTSKVDISHSTGGPIALNRAHIRMTVLGSKHAVDIQGCTPG